MKTIILLLLSWTLFGCNEVLRQDFLDPANSRLQSNGRNKAFIVPDHIRKDRFRVQDPKTGRTTHTIMPDVIRPGRYIIRKGVW